MKDPKEQIEKMVKFQSCYIKLNRSKVLNILNIWFESWARIKYLELHISQNLKWEIHDNCIRNKNGRRISQ